MKMMKMDSGFNRGNLPFYTLKLLDNAGLNANVNNNVYERA